MKLQALCRRTTWEIVRDPLNLAFGLGFPLVLLLLLSAIQTNVPVDLFAIDRLTPGISVFGLAFIALFSATLVARDRESALLQRLYTAPLTAGDESLWTQLTLCREASAARVAEALYPADLTRQADFYSELCTKRSRGRAVAWTLEQGSTVVCTVGAYALCNGQAYMACGQTAEPLRGKGIGGRLIVKMANSLAAEGLRPVFLCAPERVRFYTRLGFAKQAEYARYVPEKC